MKRLSFFLGLGIICLCIGLLLSNCGSGPTLKITDPNKCTGAITCPGIANLNDGWHYIGIGAGRIMSNSDITFEAWVKMATTTTEGPIFLRGSGVSLQVQNSFAAFRAETVYASSTTVVNDNAWHHIAGVFSGAAHNHSGTTTTCTLAAQLDKHIDIYVDGVFENCNGPFGDYPAGVGLECDDDATPNVTELCSNYICRNVARAVTDISANFNGIAVIDEVRIWTEARDKSVLLINPGSNLISAWMFQDNIHKKTATPNLVGYWMLNECGGHTAVDSSGLGFSGELTVCTFNCDNVPESTAHWESGWTAGYPF